MLSDGVMNYQESYNGETYRVDFKIPRFARLAQVNNNLFILQSGLFKSNMDSMRPWAAMVRIKDDFGRGHCSVDEMCSSAR